MGINQGRCKAPLALYGNEVEQVHDVVAYLREMNMVSLVFRLTLAMFSGGILGLERGRKRRPAGCRTYMLVCLGAALTVLLSQYEFSMVTGPWSDIAKELGMKTDVSRFGAQVINGIGFLGAGTILVTGRQEVKGLTTAAGLWASACMGLAIGAGFYECIALCVVLIFLCMRFLPALENAMVERARFINIYLEFESLDDIGTIIAQIKAQGATICDVDIGHGRSESSQNPSAVFAVRLNEKQPHTQVLTAIAQVDSVYIIEEI